MIKKVLIPNRGEIAVRIIKAAHELGIRTLVMLSELEKETLPAKYSDEVHYFAAGPLSDNYLNIAHIIRIAHQYNADSIHPGYGFLSENYNLAKACNDASLIFIGPSADNLKLMGDKQMARTVAKKANIPLTQSWKGTIQSILSKADSMPYPVLVKAALGGGGKGMQVINNKDEIIHHLPLLGQQAKRYFGDERLYVEQYLPQARHIEVQILADKQGNTVHLFERECSIQRRFQKLIEEAPAYNLSKEIKHTLYADAIKLCKAINFNNAGTVEFLVDNSGKYYFLEMNTRIQVEHCVTEEITGIDLVQWQFKVANNELLTFNQKAIKTNGHAIELRICAEDPFRNFQPSPGKMQSLVLPNTLDARIEIGFEKAVVVHQQFDPMLAKLIVHGSTREQAIKKAILTNQELIIRGIQTNGLYLNSILKHPDYIKGDTHTRFCETNHKEVVKKQSVDPESYALAYAIYRFEKIKNKFWRLLPKLTFTIANIVHIATGRNKDNKQIIVLDNKSYHVQNTILQDNKLSFYINEQNLKFHCFHENEKYEIIHQLHSLIAIAHDRLPSFQPANKNEAENKDKQLKAPIPSQVMKVNINEGQEVKKGDLLLVLEAMKTENHILAWKDGIIDKIHIKMGEQVKLNQLLINYQD